MYAATVIATRMLPREVQRSVFYISISAVIREAHKYAITTYPPHSQTHPHLHPHPPDTHCEYKKQDVIQRSDFADGLHGEDEDEGAEDEQ